ncbi:response regulator transcription factor [Nonomuraea sp. NPDC050451]|uniref:response regulator transcription factor n=1 Tax=Nonomuraea sp. NPDC050451 TaxID=3364364 RepID=UPI0037A8EA73
MEGLTRDPSDDRGRRLDFDADDMVLRALRPHREEAWREPGKLNDRERQVAVEVARGRSNTEIAQKLYMSVATVKANITRIFAKLGTDNRVQVAIGLL